MNANADARQFNRKNAPGITIKEQPSTTATGDRDQDQENMARYYRLARTSHKNARNQML